MKEEIEKIEMKLGQIRGVLHALQVVIDVPIDGCAKERYRMHSSAATLLDMLENITEETFSACVDAHEASNKILETSGRFL